MVKSTLFPMKAGSIFISMMAERGCIDAAEKDFLTLLSASMTEFGGGSVMVWAGVTMNQRTRLCIVGGNLNVLRYVDEILRPVVVPFLGRMNQEGSLQDDNARPIVDALLMNLFDSSTSGDFFE